MAQAAPSADSDSPPPLPRRPAPRPQAARVSRPRFAALDGAWTVVLAALSLALSARLGGLAGSHLLGSAAAAGTVAALYLLGWRARDRAAGVAAGLLAATSAVFLSGAAYSPQSAAFGLLTVSALFAFVAGSSLAALALCAAAAIVRPDGLLLGLLLLGLALAQGRKRALIGAAVLLVPILAAGAGRYWLGHGQPGLPAFGFQAGLLLWLGAPAAGLLAWQTLPLCGEMSEPQRRARWLPVILWAMLAAAEALLLAWTTPTGMRLALMPLLFALSGGGLSRLLPALAGEIPVPAVRYALATLAVLGLVGLHVRLEPPVPKVVSTSAAPARHSR